MKRLTKLLKIHKFYISGFHIPSLNIELILKIGKVLEVYFRENYNFHHSILIVMLEISKSILVRYSFNKDLFSSELKKLVLLMGGNPDESRNLHEWCRDSYGKKFGREIRRAFKKHV